MVSLPSAIFILITLHIHHIFQFLLFLLQIVVCGTADLSPCYLLRVGCSLYIFNILFG